MMVYVKLVLMKLKRSRLLDQCSVKLVLSCCIRMVDFTSKLSSKYASSHAISLCNVISIDFMSGFFSLTVYEGVCSVVNCIEYFFKCLLNIFIKT